MKTLSRDEMKIILGGLIAPPPTEAWKCCIGSECTPCSQAPGCGTNAKQIKCWD